MGLLSQLRGMFSRGASPNAALPTLTAQASMGVTESVNSGRQQSIWSMYASPGLGNWWGASYTMYSDRARTLENSIARDLIDKNPTLAAASQSQIDNIVGMGLTLSARPDAAALGITTQQARDLAKVIEKEWRTYAENPTECDYVGRHTLHELVACGVNEYFQSGEIAAIIEIAKSPFSNTYTKCRLLDSRQVDQTRSRMEENGLRSANGVVFTEDGRYVGAYVLPHSIGNHRTTNAAKFLPAYMPWGRPYLVLIGELRRPNQTRGKTPLSAALSPAHARSSAAEFVLDSFLAQTASSIVVTSKDTAEVAAKTFNPMDPAAVMENGNASHSVGQVNFQHWAQARNEWYKKAKPTVKGGGINFLAPGDEMNILRAENPHQNYDRLDKQMGRQAARAAGSSYEETTGDMEATSFSASRLALVPAHRAAMRRRAFIAKKLYVAVYRAWLEEMFETGRIASPSRHRFYERRAAYSNADFLGWGQITADRGKEARAIRDELESGQTSLTDVLGEKGKDLESHIEELSHERELLETAGLGHLVPGVSKMQRDPSDDEDDEPQQQPRRRVA